MLSGLSIRNQLRVLTVGVALPLAALAAIAIANDFRTSVRLAEHQTNGIAFATATTVGRFLAEAHGIAGGLAANPEVAAMDPGRCRGALAPVAAIVPQASNLSVNRLDGSLVCTVLPVSDASRFTVADRPWARAAIERGVPTISPPIIGRISQSWISSLTYPVRDPEGRLTGSLTFALDLDYLQGLVESIELPEGGLLTIADTTSVVVARSEDGERYIGTRMPFERGDEDWADLSLGRGFNYAPGLDGIERMFAFHVVEDAPWVVWSGIPTTVVYAPAFAALYPKLLLAVLILAITSLVAWILNGRVRDSVASLTYAMRAAEHAPVTVDESGPAELAEIASQYNRILRERRRAEAEASMHADRRELVLRAVTECVWDWDLQSDRITANRHFFEVVGGRPSEPGESAAFWQACIHPEDHDRVGEGRARVLDEGADTWSHEYRLMRANGSYVEVIDRGYALRNEEGTPIRLVGAIMDMTEPRRTQRLIDEARERYRSIVRHAFFGVYVARPDGRLVEVNPAFANMLGFPDRETALATNESAFYVNPDERVRHVEAALAGRAGGEHHARWRRVDGAIRTVRLFRTTHRDADGSKLLEVIAEDLTERRALEEQARQAQKMDAMGRLAGGVAHDFNNRLTVIRGRAQLIRNDLGNRAEVLESIDAILDAADGAARLTRELLAVSRKQLYRPRTLWPNDFVGRATESLRRACGDDLALQVRLDPSVSTIVADPDQLEQILVNLVLNARDALPQGGTVEVETEPYTVSESEARGFAGLGPGRYVRFVVRDEGAGMSPDVLERVFEPFFTTKPGGRAQGLGMATVYGLTKQNDGYVRIDSAPGRGTIVELLFPAVEPADGGEADRPTGVRAS